MGGGARQFLRFPAVPAGDTHPQEALDNIKDAAEIYIEDMIETGEGMPQLSSAIELIDEPAIAVSL